VEDIIAEFEANGSSFEDVDVRETVVAFFAGSISFVALFAIVRVWSKSKSDQIDAAATFRRHEYKSLGEVHEKPVGDASARPVSGEGLQQGSTPLIDEPYPSL